MPKQEGQKSKLVTLLRILEQRTDENHRLNVPQLVQLLEIRAFWPSARAFTATLTPCAVWATTSSCNGGAAAGTGWPAVRSSFRS